MAAKNGVHDDTNNVSWPLIKYTKLVGTRLEIPVAFGQVMAIIYNKNRCYLSIMFNSSTLEEFSLAVNPRPTIRSKDKDIFIQVSSANGTTLTRFRIKFATSLDHSSFVEFISFFVKVLPPSNMNTSSDFSQSLSSSVDEKIYETLKPIKHPAVRRCCESSEISPVTFSQSSETRMLSCLKTSKISDQTVPFSADDVEMTVTQPFMDFPLAVHFNSKSDGNCGQENRRSVGIQTEYYLSINDLLDDSSRLTEYLTSKLQDHQFIQLVEKCSQIYDTIFHTVEASSVVSSSKIFTPTKMRHFKK